MTRVRVYGTKYYIGTGLLSVVGTTILPAWSHTN
jgi:hypothetical protein